MMHLAPIWLRLPPHRAARLVLLAFCATVLAGCASITITTEPRAVLLGDDRKVQVHRLNCPEAAEQARRTRAGAAALDPSGFHLLTWNIHKQGDKGWQEDLATFVRRSDIVLLQELVLEPGIRNIIEDAGLEWAMASSFQNSEIDIGVLTAARVTPLATCTQRVVEPILRIPKSSVITWYAIKGSRQTVAVANMHAINFSLMLGAYREQLDAMREALAGHQGPIVFAGDLNTWTQARYDAVEETAKALGMTEISFAEDRRKLFMGKQLDHIFIRGLTMSQSFATEVTSSDHNPVEATLRLP